MKYKLHNGNCVNILKQYKDGVDMVLTSPPYDDLRKYKGYSFEFEKIADGIVSSLKEGGVLVWVVNDATIDGSETGSSFRQALGFMERGLKLHDTMFFKKVNGEKTCHNRYSQVIEYMFILSKGKPKTANLIRDKKNVTAGHVSKKYAPGRDKDGKKTRLEGSVVHAEYGARINVWEYVTSGYSMAEKSFKKKRDDTHPAMFPYKLACDHIISWSNEGDTVMDPMAGSGTTLRAALDLGRNPVGIEISKDYCKVIRERMKAPTQTTLL